MESKNDTINFVKAVESQSGKYAIVTFVHFIDEKKEYLKWIVPVQEIAKTDKPYIYGTIIELMKVAKPAPKKEDSKPIGMASPQVIKPENPDAELDQYLLPF